MVRTVILSGGYGKRLWPISKKETPKQFIRIYGKKSLFQLAVERNLTFSDSMIVVTLREYYDLAFKDIGCYDVGVEFILESSGRDTAASVALSALHSDRSDVLVIAPSDHLIRDLELYKEDLQKAIEVAKEGYVVTLGITPREPHTGYGYIEVDRESSSNGVFDVNKFHEKPSLNKAKSYILKNVENRKPIYFWNSGIFVFRAETILEQLKEHSPDVYSASEKSYFKRKILDMGVLIDDMEYIPKLSIDKAVMEKSNLLKLIPARFSWLDMGNLISIHKAIDNSVNVIELESASNMYISTESVDIISIGVKGFVVVMNGNNLLICKRELLDLLKDAVDMMYRKRENKNS